MKRKKMSELTPRQRELRIEKIQVDKLKKEADNLWHKAVIKKYGRDCFFHNHSLRATNHIKTAFTCHHYFPKGCYPELRYDIDNGVPMCWPCHFRLENRDKSMRDEILLKRGVEWYQGLRDISMKKDKSYKNMLYYKKIIEQLQ